MLRVPSQRVQRHKNAPARAQQLMRGTGEESDEHGEDEETGHDYERDERQRRTPPVGSHGGS